MTKGPLRPSSPAVTAHNTAALPELVTSAPAPPSTSASTSANVSTDGLLNREYAYPLRDPEKIASASAEVPKSKRVLCAMGR